MNVKDMIKNRTVKFVQFRDGLLTYRIDNGFEFDVPVSDAGTAIFKSEDKAIFFMRWIRKAVEAQEQFELLRKENCIN